MVQTHQCKPHVAVSIVDGVVRSLRILAKVPNVMRTITDISDMCARAAVFSASRFVHGAYGRIELGASFLLERIDVADQTVSMDTMAANRIRMIYVNSCNKIEPRNLMLLTR